MGVYFGYLYNCYFGYCNSDGTNTPKKQIQRACRKAKPYPLVELKS